MRKLLSSLPLIVFPRLEEFPLHSKKASPQRDTATAMLRGGGAIRRVMSCAQFPPDNKLCFMAESSLSISSDATSSMNRALHSSLSFERPFFFFSLPRPSPCAAGSDFPRSCTALRSRFIKCCGHCGSSSNIRHGGQSRSATLSNSSSDSWVTSTSELFLGGWRRLDGLPGEL